MDEDKQVIVAKTVNTKKSYFTEVDSSTGFVIDEW